MKHVDMRKLPAAAQEERRRQVIGLRQAGQTYDAIAAQVGLSPTGVFDIVKRYAERGAAGLQTGPRGPEPGHGRFLGAEEELEAQVLIQRHTPDELGLPFALWSRAAVRELIWQRFGVRLAVRTMGTYLARWGFTAQKPLRRAYEQDPAAVRRWLRHDYPAIAARAKAEGSVVFWGDETGLRSDDVRGRSYAPRGRTPEVRVNHKRANLGLISAVTNKGELRWMVLDGAITAPDLLRFLARLVRDAGQKVVLILNRLPVHRSAKVRDWLVGREAEIEVFYLPGYSPELNPDEGVNGDLKQAVTRQEPARSKAQLKRAAIGHMRKLSKLPDRVRSFFGHRTFRYAA
ncbi:IS630 family transposase [Siccirubricoccus sp. G192]|uniref:IS630 family transposase n=1 Tax=Siccirubricoccus sp. G192 TaxID=2849651 RepID=UPI001C2BFDFF|nr:IS630 family transposase [Siccirubricoccus sp. G192]MBV1799435.1 IS630 family transposase [Siccirubricoccus sp. G192]